MRRRVVLLLAAMLAVAATSTVTSAQCQFPHPAQANKMQISLVQAFTNCVSCTDERFCHGGSIANTTTGDGVPACGPPETFNEQAGSPPNGWLWGPKGVMSVQFKALKKNFDPTTTPADPDASDLLVQLKGRDIEYAPGDGSALVNGQNGELGTVGRTTFNDPTSGAVTVVDFPVTFSFGVIHGNVKMKRSVNEQLNHGGLAGLPHCTSIETVVTVIRDEANHAFATAGVFLP